MGCRLREDGCITGAGEIRGPAERMGRPALRMQLSAVRIEILP